MRVLTAATALLFLSLGCGGVLSTHPVGIEPLAVDRGDWEGTWVDEEEAFEIRVVDASAGRLEVAWIEEEGGGFHLRTLPLELRRIDDWTIGNLYDEDEEKYLWLRLEWGASTLLAWLPDEDEFARLVRNGELPGRIEGDEPVLARLEARHLARIRDESGGALFVWDEPLVLRRLGP